MKKQHNLLKKIKKSEA